jgi:sugar/nucleoside kinase (ribokinase family)
LTRPRVVVAGNLSLDDTVTPDATFPDAPGGDALYASLAVRTWGGRPILLTLVGDDYPQPYLDRMRSTGIDTTHVRITEGPTVHYRVIYGVDGARTFQWVGAEERLLQTSPVGTDYSALADAEWLHVAAMPIEAQHAGIAAGRAAGVPISLDPHEEYVVGYEDQLRALADGVVFMPSELEARLLFPDIDVADPVDFAKAAAERLDAWGSSVVAIKLGRRGSVVRVDGRSTHVPALSTNVVDPTGAGDAYCGGFVVGWLATGDAAAAAACGTVAGSETIGRFGAFSEDPSATEEQRLERIGHVLGSVAGTTAGWIETTVDSLRRAMTGSRIGAHR